MCRTLGSRRRRRRRTTTTTKSTSHLSLLDCLSAAVY
jgi:hypothetical protein